ncbi:MAG: hypothetical protein K940chlam9_01316 [Chlamydiae bacterium]|nr:hypothetical protein [Chlamydiota bacterium]
MLQGLFGNKSVERILLFLLVNEKTYAMQLHRLLNTPLTPLQKALEKLEKEGILTSSREGKIRYYTLNPSYPLLSELELLLKKAYSLLAPQEKKAYYSIRHIPSEHKRNQALLLATWKQLQAIEKVDFRFRSRGGEQGEGAGEVSVEYDGKGAIVFRESGVWKGAGDREFRFSNLFRWTLSRIDSLLTLEHLRYGVHNPVFLFHLIPTEENLFASVHAHQCGEDTYLGHLAAKSKALELTWRILGPRKNDVVTYLYT